MTERSFYRDEFEELIRDKTGQYKMYPSERVWKGIFSSLHTKRKRFVIGMSALIGGILLIAGIDYLQPTKHSSSLVKFTFAHVPESGPARALNSLLDQNRQHQGHFSLRRNDSPSEDRGALEDLAASGTGAREGKPTARDVFAAYGDPSTYSISQDLPEGAGHAPAFAGRDLSAETYLSPSLVSLANPSGQPLRLNASTAQQSSSDGKIPTAENTADAKDNNSANHRVNWLEEFAVEHLVPTKQRRFSLQVYFSPTADYRNLYGSSADASKPAVQNVPVALAHFGNVNNFVNHTPAVGFELGSSLMYRLSRRLTLKGGIQFNFSKYNIMAYASGPEIGTIALNNSYSSYLGYLIGDSISSYSNVRNFGGKSRITLQNKYYQLSAPVGLEYRLLGTGRLQLFIAGTVQPTYLLNRNSYLLTTDYMSYIKEPSLFRKWNVNAGLEAYVAYQAGGLRWQIGPQFRYQLLSTYTDDYPLTENLKEYGIKIGVSKIFH